MSEPEQDHPAPDLVETRLEQRDGATWVSGVCPFCWEGLAFVAPPEGRTATVQCPNGHPLVIRDRRSEGSLRQRRWSCRQPP
jgi:hypothetical protein